jgi:dolichol-phosphate mannosyltransferase
MIYILLPAYNEVNDIASLLEEFAKSHVPEPYRVVIVNDGSTDGTADAVNSFAGRLPLTLLSHKTNLGLGKALSTGISHISSLMAEGDILVTMDADNSHKPSLIESLARKISDGYGVVIASRFREGASEQGVPAARRLLSFFGGRLVNVVFRLEGVRDYTSGYRAFSSGTVMRLKERFGGDIVTESGFAATLELLLKAGKTGARMAEVPLALRYDQKTGKSKMRVLRTIYQYIKLIARIGSA